MQDGNIIDPKENVFENTSNPLPKGLEPGAGEAKTPRLKKVGKKKLAEDVYAGKDIITQPFEAEQIIENKVWNDAGGVYGKLPFETKSYEPGSLKDLEFKYDKLKAPVVKTDESFGTPVISIDTTSNFLNLFGKPEQALPNSLVEVSSEIHGRLSNISDKVSAFPQIEGIFKPIRLGLSKIASDIDNVAIDLDRNGYVSSWFDLKSKSTKYKILKDPDYVTKRMGEIGILGEKAKLLIDSYTKTYKAYDDNGLILTNDEYSFYSDFIGKHPEFASVEEGRKAKLLTPEVKGNIKYQTDGQFDINKFNEDYKVLNSKVTSQTSKLTDPRGVMGVQFNAQANPYANLTEEEIKRYETIKQWKVLTDLSNAKPKIQDFSWETLGNNFMQGLWNGTIGTTHAWMDLIPTQDKYKEKWKLEDIVDKNTLDIHFLKKYDKDIDPNTLVSMQNLNEWIKVPRYADELAKLTAQTGQTTGQMIPFIALLGMAGVNRGILEYTGISEKLAMEPGVLKYMAEVFKPGVMPKLWTTLGKSALVGELLTFPNYLEANLGKIDPKDHSWWEYPVRILQSITQAGMEGMSEVMGGVFLGGLVGKTLRKVVPPGLLLELIDNKVTNYLIAENVGEVLEERINDIPEIIETLATNKWTDDEGNVHYGFGGYLKDMVDRSFSEYLMFMPSSILQSVGVFGMNALNLPTYIQLNKIQGLIKENLANKLGSIEGLSKEDISKITHHVFAEYKDLVANGSIKGKREEKGKDVKEIFDNMWKIAGEESLDYVNTQSVYNFAKSEVIKEQSKAPKSNIMANSLEPQGELSNELVEQQKSINDADKITSEVMTRLGVYETPEAQAEIQERIQKGELAAVREEIRARTTETLRGINEQQLARNKFYSSGKEMEFMGTENVTLESFNKLSNENAKTTGELLKNIVGVGETIKLDTLVDGMKREGLIDNKKSVENKILDAFALKAGDTDISLSNEEQDAELKGKWGYNKGNKIVFNANHKQVGYLKKGVIHEGAHRILTQVINSDKDLSQKLTQIITDLKYTGINLAEVNNPESVARDKMLGRLSVVAIPNSYVDDIMATFNSPHEFVARLLEGGQFTKLIKYIENENKGIYQRIKDWVSAALDKWLGGTLDSGARGEIVKILLETPTSETTDTEVHGSEGEYTDPTEKTRFTLDGYVYGFVPKGESLHGEPQNRDFYYKILEVHELSSDKAPIRISKTEYWEAWEKVGKLFSTGEIPTTDFRSKILSLNNKQRGQFIAEVDLVLKTRSNQLKGYKPLLLQGKLDNDLVQKVISIVGQAKIENILDSILNVKPGVDNIVKEIETELKQANNKLLKQSVEVIKQKSDSNATQDKEDKPNLSSETGIKAKQNPENIKGETTRHAKSGIIRTLTESDGVHIYSNDLDMVNDMNSIRLQAQNDILDKKTKLSLRSRMFEIFYDKTKPKIGELKLAELDNKQFKENTRYYLEDIFANLINKVDHTVYTLTWDVTYVKSIEQEVIQEEFKDKKGNIVQPGIVRNKEVSKPKNQLYAELHNGEWKDASGIGQSTIYDKTVLEDLLNDIELKTGKKFKIYEVKNIARRQAGVDYKQRFKVFNTSNTEDVFETSKTGIDLSSPKVIDQLYKQGFVLLHNENGLYLLDLSSIPPEIIDAGKSLVGNENEATKVSMAAFEYFWKTVLPLDKDLKVLKRMTAVNSEASRSYISREVKSRVGKRTANDSYWVDGDKLMINWSMLSCEDDATLKIIKDELGIDLKRITKDFLMDGAVFTIEDAHDVFNMLNGIPVENWGIANKWKTLEWNDKFFKCADFSVSPDSRLGRFMNKNGIGRLVMTSADKIKTGIIDNNKNSTISYIQPWYIIKDAEISKLGLELPFIQTYDMMKDTFLQSAGHTNESIGGVLPAELTTNLISEMNMLKSEYPNKESNYSKDILSHLNSHIDALMTDIKPIITSKDLEENAEKIISELKKSIDNMNFKPAAARFLESINLSNYKNLAYIHEISDLYCKNILSEKIVSTLRHTERGSSPVLMPDGMGLTDYRGKLEAQNTKMGGKFKDIDYTDYFYPSGAIKENFCILTEDVAYALGIKKEEVRKFIQDKTDADNKVFVVNNPPAATMEKRAMRVIGILNNRDFKYGGYSTKVDKNGIVINIRQAQLISGKDYDVDKVMVVPANSDKMRDMWNAINKANLDDRFWKKLEAFESIDYYKGDNKQLKDGIPIKTVSKLNDMFGLTEEDKVVDKGLAHIIALFGANEEFKQLDFKNPTTYRNIAKWLKYNMIGVVYNTRLLNALVHEIEDKGGSVKFGNTTLTTNTKFKDRNEILLYHLTNMSVDWMNNQKIFTLNFEYYINDDKGRPRLIADGVKGFSYKLRDIIFQVVDEDGKLTNIKPAMFIKEIVSNDFHALRDLLKDTNDDYRTGFSLLTEQIEKAEMSIRGGDNMFIGSTLHETVKHFVDNFDLGPLIPTEAQIASWYKSLVEHLQADLESDIGILKSRKSLDIVLQILGNLNALTHSNINEKNQYGIGNTNNNAVLGTLAIMCNKLQGLGSEQFLSEQGVLKLSTIFIRVIQKMIDSKSFSLGTWTKSFVNYTDNWKSTKMRAPYIEIAPYRPGTVRTDEEGNKKVVRHGLYFFITAETDEGMFTNEGKVYSKGNYTGKVVFTREEYQQGKLINRIKYDTFYDMATKNQTVVNIMNGTNVQQSQNFDPERTLSYLANNFAQFFELKDNTLLRTLIANTLEEQFTDIVNSKWFTSSPIEQQRVFFKAMFGTYDDAKKGIRKLTHRVTLSNVTTTGKTYERVKLPKITVTKETDEKTGNVRYFAGKTEKTEAEYEKYKANPQAKVSSWNTQINPNHDSFFRPSYLLSSVDNDIAKEVLNDVLTNLDSSIGLSKSNILTGNNRVEDIISTDDLSDMLHASTGEQFEGYLTTDKLEKPFAIAELINKTVQRILPTLNTAEQNQIVINYWNSQHLNKKDKIKNTKELTDIHKEAWLVAAMEDLYMFKISTDSYKPKDFAKLIRLFERDVTHSWYRFKGLGIRALSLPYNYMVKYYSDKNIGWGVDDAVRFSCLGEKKRGTVDLTGIRAMMDIIEPPNKAEKVSGSQIDLRTRHQIQAAFSDIQQKVGHYANTMIGVTLSGNFTVHRKLTGDLNDELYESQAKDDALKKTKKSLITYNELPLSALKMKGFHMFITDLTEGKDKHKLLSGIKISMDNGQYLVQYNEDGLTIDLHVGNFGEALDNQKLFDIAEQICQVKGITKHDLVSIRNTVIVKGMVVALANRVVFDAFTNEFLERFKKDLVFANEQIFGMEVKAEEFRVIQRDEKGKIINDKVDIGEQIENETYYKAQAHSLISSTLRQVNAMQKQIKGMKAASAKKGEFYYTHLWENDKVYADNLTYAIYKSKEKESGTVDKEKLMEEAKKEAESLMKKEKAGSIINMGSLRLYNQFFRKREYDMKGYMKTPKVIEVYLNQLCNFARLAMMDVYKAINEPYMQKDTKFMRHEMNVSLALVKGQDTYFEYVKNIKNLRKNTPIMFELKQHNKRGEVYYMTKAADFLSYDNSKVTVQNYDGSKDTYSVFNIKNTRQRQGLTQGRKLLEFVHRWYSDEFEEFKWTDNEGVEHTEMVYKPNKAESFFITFNNLVSTVAHIKLQIGNYAMLQAKPWYGLRNAFGGMINDIGMMGTDAFKKEGGKFTSLYKEYSGHIQSLKEGGGGLEGLDKQAVIMLADEASIFFGGALDLMGRFGGILKGSKEHLSNDLINAWIKSGMLRPEWDSEIKRAQEVIQTLKEKPEDIGLQRKLSDINSLITRIKAGWSNTGLYNIPFASFFGFPVRLIPIVREMFIFANATDVENINRVETASIVINRVNVLFDEFKNIADDNGVTAKIVSDFQNKFTYNLIQHIENTTQFQYNPGLFLSHFDSTLMGKALFKQFSHYQNSLERVAVNRLFNMLRQAQNYGWTREVLPFGNYGFKGLITIKNKDGTSTQVPYIEWKQSTEFVRMTFLAVMTGLLSKMSSVTKKALFYGYMTNGMIKVVDLIFMSQLADSIQIPIINGIIKSIFYIIGFAFNTVPKDDDDDFEKWMKLLLHSEGTQRLEDFITTTKLHMKGKDRFGNSNWEQVMNDNDIIKDYFYNMAKFVAGIDAGSGVGEIQGKVWVGSTADFLIEGMFVPQDLWPFVWNLAGTLFPSLSSVITPAIKTIENSPEVPVELRQFLLNLPIGQTNLQNQLRELKAYNLGETAKNAEIKKVNDEIKKQVEIDARTFLTIPVTGGQEIDKLYQTSLDTYKDFYFKKVIGLEREETYNEVEKLKKEFTPSVALKLAVKFFTAKMNIADLDEGERKYLQTEIEKILDGDYLDKKEKGKLLKSDMKKLLFISYVNKLLEGTRTKLSTPEEIKDKSFESLFDNEGNIIENPLKRSKKTE